MRLPGWSVVCDSCRNGEHMCGGDCDCLDVWCLKRRLKRQGVEFHTEVDRFPASKASAETIGLLIEGNCPVHRSELRCEADGRGYCDACAADMGAVAVGYRVRSVTE